MAKGAAAAVAGIGVLFVYSGVTGKSVLTEIGTLIRGKSPSTAPKVEPINAPASSSGSGSGSGGGSASYTGSALQKLWTDNGGSQDTAAISEAIAQAESGGSATVTSSNPDGGTNVGIYQLDTKGVGSGYTVAELQDANLNAHITIAATNNGTNWTEWGDPVANALPNHYYEPGSAIPGGSIIG